MMVVQGMRLDGTPLTHAGVCTSRGVFVETVKKVVSLGFCFVCFVFCLCFFVWCASFLAFIFVVVYCYWYFHSFSVLYAIKNMCLVGFALCCCLFPPLSAYK